MVVKASCPPSLIPKCYVLTKQTSWETNVESLGEGVYLVHLLKDNSGVLSIFAALSKNATVARIDHKMQIKVVWNTILIQF